MKKAIIMLAVILGCMSASAQQVNKNELKQLQAFLTQNSEKEGTNAQALGISDLKNPASWEGVKVENGHVTSIEWKDKKLAGTLNLSGFTALQSLDVSRNSLTSLNVSGDAALSELNAYRNRLTAANLDGCTGLVNVKIYKNRLTDFEISATPMIKTLNVSNNYLVDLNVSNSSTLETLNCQGNHLEIRKSVV